MPEYSARIADDIDGGIGVFVFDRKCYLWLCFDDGGEVSALLSDDTDEKRMQSWSIKTLADVREAFEKARGFFAAGRGAGEEGT